MTNAEFQKKLAAMFEKHPLINKSDPKSLNELMYVLRMESDVDYGISTTDGTCIPSVKETFVPTKTLARKVLSTRYEEYTDDGETYGTIIVELN